MTSSALRSPQHMKTHNAAYNSDEIQTGGIPSVAPPRPPRQRHGSVSSSVMSGSQYYQPYQPQHYQYENYMSSSPPSSRPSPRSSQPSSPLTFQLPPSALSSTREESMRSGSISYHPNNNLNNYNTQPIQVPQLSPCTSSAASSYRTPQMTPGMNGGGGSGGLVMSMMPPLSLPESFLEDQCDYAEYYSDVGFSNPPLRQPQQRQLSNIQTMPIHLQHHQMDYPMSPGSVRNGHQGGFLPSPHLTPTVSPLSDDFPSLTLGKGRPEKQSRCIQKAKHA
jgi:hypothetical protein